MERRLKENLYSSQLTKSKKSKWIIELLSLNLKPIIKELLKVPFEHWIYAEKYMIAHYRSFKKNILNTSDGGYYVVGERNEEWKRKIGLANRGRVLSKETLKKMSESHKGYKQSKESIERKSKSLRNSIKSFWKLVVKIDLENNIELEFYPSAKHASISLGLKKCGSHILECCRGQRKRSGGFGWRLVTKEEIPKIDIKGFI